MASNLLNPIQLLRGTSAAIAAAQGKEGTLYYDTDRAILVTRSDTGSNTCVRTFDDPYGQPTIFVDAVNGDDDNYGFGSDKPVKTLSKAFWLSVVRRSFLLPRIYLNTGTYYIDDASTFLQSSMHIEGAQDGVVIQCPDVTFDFCDISMNNISIIVDGTIRLTRAWCNFADCIITSTSVGSYNCVLIADHMSSFGFIGTTIDGSNIERESAISSVIGSSIHFGQTGGNIIRNVNATKAVCACTNAAIINLGAAVGNGGNVIGKRYSVDQGGVILSHSLGENALPGSEAGAVNTATGGAYY